MRNKAILMFLALTAMFATAPAMAGGDLYEVHVIVDNDAGEFDECMRFGNDGSLALVTTPMPMVWVAQLGTRRPGGFAITNRGDIVNRHAFALAMHGTRYTDGSIQGNAINEYGATFVFSGKLAHSCGAREMGGSFATVPAAIQKVAAHRAPHLAIDELRLRPVPAPFPCPPRPGYPTGAEYGEDDGCLHTKRSANNTVSVIRRPEPIRVPPPDTPPRSCSQWPPIDNLDATAGPVDCPDAVNKSESANRSADPSGSAFWIAIYNGKWIKDCWKFDNSGTLLANSGQFFTWRHTGIPPRAATFQTADSYADGGSHAYYGQVTPEGAIKLHGIQSSLAGHMPVVGYGHLEDSCSIY